MTEPWISRVSLLREWMALADLNARHRDDLEAEGVTREAIHVAGGLAWARIAPAGRTFIRSDAGKIHLIQPVWNGPAPSIYEAVEDPILMDLIAWRLDDPTTWFYRVSAQGAVLGSEALDSAHAEGTAIVLHTTPLAWLQSGCRGSVLLEECEAAWRAQKEADRDADNALAWGGNAAREAK